MSHKIGYILCARFNDGNIQTLKRFDGVEEPQLSNCEISEIIRQSDLKQENIKNVFLLEIHSDENTENSTPPKSNHTALAKTLTDTFGDTYVQNLVNDVKKYLKNRINNKSKPEDTESYEIAKVLPMTYNGQAIEALARARTIGKTKEVVGGRDITVNGVNIFSPDSALKIGVGTTKIMRYAITEFARLNHQNIQSEKINLRIFLNLNDYANANGFDISKSDAKRNFRRKLKGDLEKFRTAGLSWSEKVQGKPRTYTGLSYISDYHVGIDTIMVVFGLGMAEYLVSLPLMQYPRALYRLDDRDSNAFVIGEMMTAHYSIDNNVMKGTYNRLRVETFLKYTSYPSYDKLQAQNSGWESNIKERFEECLERLRQCGFLKDWKYCNPGGVELTDEQAYNINSYGDFISLLVMYELNDYDSPEKRTKIIEEKKAANMKKLQAGNKKRKKSDSN